MSPVAVFRHTRLLQLVLALSLGVPLSWSAEKPNPLLNTYLNPKLEEILKNSMKVIGENDDEGILFLSMPKGRSFANGTQIIFFRKRHSRLEVISVGKVDGEGIDPKTKRMGIKVNVDRDTILKYPVLGDNAAPMSDPNALGNGEKRDEFDFLMPIEDGPRTPNDRPGYLEYGLGVMSGKMATTTSTVANDSKTPQPYRFKITHLVYYSDFAPIGIEYDSHEGLFPTATYYQTLVATRESVSTMTFNYRFMPMFNKKLEIIARLAMLNDKFVTSNADEHLLSTTVSGTGIGAKINWNFASPIWSQGAREPFFKFQNLFVEAHFYPSITASDDGVSRGTESNGSSALQYRVGGAMLFWFDFIPVLKRWVVQGSYGVKSYNLKFSGDTTPEDVVGPTEIPKGTIGTEKETDLRFFIGVRFEDPIRLLFSGEKDKKNKK